MAEPARKTAKEKVSTQKKFNELEPIAEKSKEIVIGLVGYAGSGCSTLAVSIQAALEDSYKAEIIKVSEIIKEIRTSIQIPPLETGTKKGQSLLLRATALQDAGDEIRMGADFALASHVIKRIIDIRKKFGDPNGKNAFIIDQLKHESEVFLLREVYGSSFKLIAVHCDPKRRFERLYGEKDSQSKFAGASKEDVKKFMKRDEKDSSNKHGQQVREVFHLADYFIDHSQEEHVPISNNDKLKRFFEILLGQGFHRPEPHETAMYTAVSAALRSSCLSRQVGAALIGKGGELLSIGSNDVPRYGGGTYLEASTPDARCAVWEFRDDAISFIGCHNTRHKNKIREEIVSHIREKITLGLNDALKDVCKLNVDIDQATLLSEKIIENDMELPKIGDLIEFSRSIHAEMDAIISAARQGKSTVGATLYCTTFPCHNCARHIVAAGIETVFYIEPYVKSLAYDLHSDSIETASAPSQSKNADEEPKQTKLHVLPFTGVGPRMYEQHFLKVGELKNAKGEITPPNVGKPIDGARLDALTSIEEKPLNSFEAQIWA